MFSSIDWMFFWPYLSRTNPKSTSQPNTWEPSDCVAFIRGHHCCLSRIASRVRTPEFQLEGLCYHCIISPYRVCPKILLHNSQQFPTPWKWEAEHFPLTAVKSVSPSQFSSTGTVHLPNGVFGDIYPVILTSLDETWWLSGNTCLLDGKPAVINGLRQTRDINNELQ